MYYYIFTCARDNIYTKYAALKIPLKKFQTLKRYRQNIICNFFGFLVINAVKPKYCETVIKEDNGVSHSVKIQYLLKIANKVTFN